MGLLSNASAWLNTQLGTAAGISLTYTRGPVTLTLAEADGEAWAGDSLHRETRDGGPRVAWAERQYLILASAMGDLDEPEDGDRITETLDGVARVFEVAAGGNGEPAARWSDVERTVWRVNTKRVS